MNRPKTAFRFLAPSGIPPQFIYLQFIRLWVWIPQCSWQRGSEFLETRCWASRTLLLIKQGYSLVPCDEADFCVILARTWISKNTAQCLTKLRKGEEGRHNWCGGYTGPRRLWECPQKSYRLSWGTVKILFQEFKSLRILLKAKKRQKSPVLRSIRDESLLKWQ